MEPRETAEVQDNLREYQLARLLRLERNPSRTGSDARDEFGNLYELKTVTTDQVTTGRDIGLPYLARLRRSYMVIARGTQNAYGFTPEVIYFLAPPMMEDWIQRYERRLRVATKLTERAVNDLRQRGWDDADIEKLLALTKRGMTINNPKISWSYVRSHGVRLNEPPALHLRHLIEQYPLPESVGVVGDEDATIGLGELEDEPGL